MTNHPNRGKNPHTPGRTPRPEEVSAARVARGLTQLACAKIVHTGIRSWQQWEAGDRRMHPAMWELFLKKTKVLATAAPEAVPDDAPPKAE